MADREKVIEILSRHKTMTFGDKIYDGIQFDLGDVVAMLKEQEAVVRCKDCDNKECDGRDGTIVCGITGESHSRLWFCADGERRVKWK